jgi:hypothetical protein
MATTLTPALRKQSRESPFIFLGRVTAVGENNLQGFAATDKHALVEVEQVLLAPTTLGELRGRLLTVVLAAPAKKGTRAVWWATSWVFEREIGVIETGRGDAARTLAAAADIIGERLAALDAAVAARIAGADLVIAGHVIDIEDLGPDGIAEGTTWRRARVRPSTVVRGKAGVEEVIQFPGAGSPRWAAAPRLVAHQEGVWLLRKPSREARLRKVKIVEAWVALDPNDAFGISSLPRIEALLHSAQLASLRTPRSR